MNIKKPPMPAPDVTALCEYPDAYGRMNDLAYTADQLTDRDAEWLKLVEPVVEALKGLLVGNEWRCLQGEWAWHSKTMPSNDALSSARAALAAITEEQQ